MLKFFLIELIIEDDTYGNNVNYYILLFNDFFRNYLDIE